MNVRVLAGVAWLLAVALHPWVPREAPSLAPASRPVLAALSGGHASVAASAAWVQTVQHFANTDADAEVVERGIRDAVAFDPTLQPPLVHGTLMVRRLGARGAVPGLLELGMAHFPDEAWFPWAMGMHVWIDGNDPEHAAEWLDRAAKLEPGSVHSEASDALRGIR